MKSRTSVHDRFATDYDRQIREYHCFAADVLFGLSFEYVHAGERLLDLGIGTGLSSWPFAQLGLQVSGSDSSADMLDICRSKNVALELEQFDLQDTPWPYVDSSFDHVVSCGVLHFIEDLAPIFAQVALVIRANGIFAFTTKVPPEKSHRTIQETTEGVSVFMHSRDYVERCMTNSQFEMLKDLEFSVGNSSTGGIELFWAFIVRKAVT